MICCKKSCLYLFVGMLNILCIALYAQDKSVSFSYNGGRNYILVEKTDLLRYDNNKYTGLLSREVQSFVAENKELSSAEMAYYDGYFYVVQDTKHKKRVVIEGIHDSISSAFKITKDGELLMIKDNGYPSFRSFPSYPSGKIKVGDSWQAKGIRAVDPLDTGIVTKLPIMVQYTFEREDVYNGEEVYVLSAKWATRYGLSYIDANGDPLLKSAQGKHDATIIISKKVGNALVVKDTVDETFLYEDGNQIRLKGTISLFTKYPPAYNKGEIISAVNKKIASKDNIVSDDSMKVQDTAKGVRISMNLKFKADSAELLPEEKSRLDKIAAALKSCAPDNMYLIEGHTASTGNPSGELKLSEERAKAVARELSARGIPEGQFICSGKGSSVPIDDNSTQEGRAKNRRVEITILQ